MGMTDARHLSMTGVSSFTIMLRQIVAFSAVKPGTETVINKSKAIKERIGNL
jgi:hypothetical protein